jgi:hypothetical protein
MGAPSKLRLGGISKVFASTVILSEIAATIEPKGLHLLLRGTRNSRKKWGAPSKLRLGGISRVFPSTVILGEVARSVTKSKDPRLPLRGFSGSPADLLTR